MSRLYGVVALVNGVLIVWGEVLVLGIGGRDQEGSQPLYLLKFENLIMTVVMLRATTSTSHTQSGVETPSAAWQAHHHSPGRVIHRTHLGSFGKYCLSGKPMNCPDVKAAYDQAYQ